MPNPHPIKILPPIKYLGECFCYNPKTGELHWKRRPRKHFPSERIWKMWNKQNAGNLITAVTRSGYLRMGRDPGYRAHRVIYKLMTSKEPPAIIDHKDGNKLNNRWTNLRPATFLQSIWNAGIHRDNVCGYKGVRLQAGKYEAAIQSNGTWRYLGRFDSAAQASAAYEAAARKLHGKFYRQQRRV